MYEGLGNPTAHNNEALPSPKIITSYFRELLERLSFRESGCLLPILSFLGHFLTSGKAGTAGWWFCACVGNGKGYGVGFYEKMAFIQMEWVQKVNFLWRIQHRMESPVNVLRHLLWPSAHPHLLSSGGPSCGSLPFSHSRHRGLWDQTWLRELLNITRKCGSQLFSASWLWSRWIQGFLTFSGNYWKKWSLTPG